MAVSTIQRPWQSLFPDFPAQQGAQFHNSIYRGKNIGTALTAAQAAAIDAGTFDDMFIGDYWMINSKKYTICDFDYYYGAGTQKHHVVVMPSSLMEIPEGTVLNASEDTLALLEGEDATIKKWSSETTTAGGYKYSRMRTVIMRAADTIVINDFGASHILPITVYYPNPASASAAAIGCKYGWFDNSTQSNITRRSICDLCNEIMIFGFVTSDISTATSGTEANPYSIGLIGNECKQLRIFALDTGFRAINQIWWLRSVATESYVLVVGNRGELIKRDISNFVLGVRPRFAVVGSNS
ncbi:MAG: hypothetical protein IKH57_05025 [Clostridia bacterium]|nr:hypothetical protein [Clostridia bacterium]MBR3106093.1 hypothetical protein [Clostridia bacterium]